MASTSSLARSKKLYKSTNRKPDIPVRQTKTSKLRTERGNKLEFLKNNLQKSPAKRINSCLKPTSALRSATKSPSLKRVTFYEPNTPTLRSFSSIKLSATIDDEDETVEIPCFNTPMAKRRSISNITPMSIPRYIPWSGCRSPIVQDLKRRLSVWMKKNGKPYNSFNHLRCFGMHYSPAEEENKENVGFGSIQSKNSSYEYLHINSSETDKKKEDISVALKTLHDLHKLILDGYSVYQCDAWLDVIRSRFEALEDEKQYLEYMTIIEKSMDECYKKNENDSCIDNLLQKFNHLNLKPSSYTPYTPRIQKRNLDMNESNIFRPTGIYFSVRETPKNEDKKILVRRSLFKMKH